MTGVASYSPDALEVLLVDRVHQQHHPARSRFQRRLVGKPLPGADALRSVAINAVQA